MAKKKEKKLELEKRKTALQAEIVRRKLLQAIVSKQKRPVAIMRRITDKIPPAFSEENSMFGSHPKKQKPSFLH